MSTEAVPNENENDLRTYQIVYRTASRATVTERYRERQSPNAIVRQSKQLPQDDYRIDLNGGSRNLVLSGALPTEGTDLYVLPNGLPK